MENDLYSLVYFSRNAIQSTGADVTEEIRRILAVSRDWNAGNHLTGALLFSGGSFAQVLEGPMSDVQFIFEKIRRDPRHSDVILLQCEPIESRRFADWSMAYATPADWLPASRSVAGALNDPSCIDCGQLGRDIVTVLQLLITGSEVTASGGSVSGTGTDAAQ